MPASKITAHTAITQIDPAVDLFELVDISDTTMDASGTNKKGTPDYVKFAALAGVQGLGLAYSSAAAVIINTGKCGVNGKLVSFTQTTYTSGSTMKNIANATVTLGNSKGYYAFISDAAVIGFEDIDGTGDGAVAVFDVAFDYYKAASTGAAWRRIGKFWTDASGNILKFAYETSGTRERSMSLQVGDGLLVVNGVQGTAAHVAVPITPYINADDNYFEMFNQAVTHSGGSGNGSIDFSLDAGTSLASRLGCGGLTAAAVYAAGREWFAYSSTFHYKAGVNLDAYLCFTGIRFLV